MKISAIICEFNPLHTGHAYLINYAKSISDKVICIMSGNFTQRGLPACANKYDRARHAILAGADLVIELPTIFATSSAENFAFGAVKIANELNVDLLVFGSELGDINSLTQVAQKLLLDDTNKEIKKNLSKGISYPKALANVLGDIVDKPNNVLAIEYIKSIIKQNYNITPITIKREDNYNTNQVTNFAGSSTLREQPLLREKYSYDFVSKDINDNIEKNYKNFVPQYISTISKDQLKIIEGVTEGIENRIVNCDVTDFEKMIESIKTKRYTRAKIQRILLNTILKITQEDVHLAKINSTTLKTLAVEQNSLQLIPSNEVQDEITYRADKFYTSLGGKPSLSKLQIIKRI